MDFYIHSMISQKVMHLAKILQERILFSIKFSIKWVYFQAAKPHGCSSIYIKIMTLLDLQLIIIITVTIQVAVLNQFS